MIEYSCLSERAAAHQFEISRAIAYQSVCLIDDFNIRSANAFARSDITEARAAKARKIFFSMFSSRRDTATHWMRGSWYSRWAIVKHYRHFTE